MRTSTAISRLVTLLSLLGALGCAKTPELERTSEIVFLGVDGLSWNRIDDLLERGELPNMRRMIEGGARVHTTAPDPLLAGALWASVQTGKLPRQHGIIEGLQPLPSGEVALAMSSARRTMSLWQMLSENERGVAVVGFPLSWPPEVVNGQLVTNSVTATRWTETAENTFPREAGRLDTYPEHLYGEIAPLIHDPQGISREEASRFFVLNEDEFAMMYDRPLGSIFQLQNPLRDFALTHQADRSYLDIARYLRGSYKPDVVGCYLELPMALQPVYWYFVEPESFPLDEAQRRRFRQTVNEAYRFVDEQIGQFLDEIGPRGTLIVASEHGFATSYAPGRDGEPDQPFPDATPEAVLLMYGRGIRPASTVRTANITDIVPTILALLDVPIGDDLHGRVLSAALDPAYLQRYAPSYRESYDLQWDQSKRFSFSTAQSTNSGAASQ